MEPKLLLRSLAVAALALAAAASPAAARPRAAAVLAVEDGGNRIVERLGARLYHRFLEEGPYDRILTVVGREEPGERLAAAIRTLAADHDVVDVVCSIHTTRRDPRRWQELIPPAARKLRLVYSTACYGNDEERAAWEAVGARAVVTHVGINNSLIALPYFLSRWIAGDPVARTVAEGYRETELVNRVAVSLPGGSAGGAMDLRGGSRPVVSGDPALTIASGLRGFTPRAPYELRYHRETGSSLGLALRALRGRFGVRGSEVADLLRRVSLPLPLAPEQLAQLEGIAIESVEVRRMDEPSDPLGLGRERPTPEARLVLYTRGTIDLPLEQGFVLRLGPRVVIKVGALDPEERTVRLVVVDGVWIVRGPLLVKLSELRLQPASGVPGYAVRAVVGFYGIVPVWKTFPIGGADPAPAVDDGPILRDGDGLVDVLERTR